MSMKSAGTHIIVTVVNKVSLQLNRQINQVDKKMEKVRWRRTSAGSEDTNYWQQRVDPQLISEKKKETTTY